MAYALVGTAGAVSTAAGSLTPAWGTGEARTAGNLLICVAGLFSVNTSDPLPQISAGWQETWNGQYPPVAVYHKIAAGGDAAPVLTNTSAQSMVGWLAEFSGNSTTLGTGQSGQSAPFDQNADSFGSTSSPTAGTGVANDLAAGELFVFGALAVYTTAATKTLTVTLSNATANSVNNNATSTVNHYSIGWGITTSNASPSSASLAFTTTKISSAHVAAATFAVDPPPPPTTAPHSRRHRSPPSHSQPRHSQGRFMVAFPKLWTPKLWLPETA